MQINVVFDASTNGAPAGFFTAVNAAVQYWEQEITNPISVTIDFGWGEVGGTAITGDAIGESSTNGSQFSYAQVRQGLINSAFSAADLASVAALPATDPTNGAGYFVPLAEAAAMGLRAGGTIEDGAVGLNASDTFDFDPDNRGASGGFDAVGGLEHEISEVLGRIAGSGQIESGVAQYAPLDLFRYSAPGQLQLTPGPAQFSVDGQNLQLFFNAPSAGDAGDWDASAIGDAFGFAQTGAPGLVSATDVEVMDVLGFRIAGTPDPSTPFSGGVFALANMTSWAFDPARDVFYFSTSSGAIKSFDPATDKTTSLLNVGQFVQAMAVSPDGSTLYVGVQGATSNPDHTLTDTIDLVNLASLAVTEGTYNGGINEVGASSMVITPGGAGYFESAIDGSGQSPLESFSTSQPFAATTVGAAPTISAGSYSSPNHDLAPSIVLSDDGRYALAYDVDSSDSSLVLLDARTGAVIASNALVNGGGLNAQNLGRADVNGETGLIVDVIPDSHVWVFDTHLSLVKDLTSPDSIRFSIIGAHFSQDGGKLYLWDAPQQELLVYSTSTWQQIGTIFLSAPEIGPYGLGGNTIGEMSLADNGRLLVLNTGVGFEIVDLRPGEHRYDLDGDGLAHLLIENSAGSVVVGTASEGATSYETIGGLGSEWKFEGAGDLLGDDKSDFLVENSAGAVVAGEVSGGQTAYTNLTALGPEWKFVGDGDFLGAGHDQFLIENTSGAVVVGNLSNGQTAFTQVAALGPEWSFHGSGDFLGDGQDQFLIENGSGAVVVGEVQNGAAVYTAVGGLGPEWKFVGVGDFLGDGKDDFLIENTAGAVIAGEVMNGQASFTQLTALGPEWKFVGAGDYLGEGHDQFLIENTAGAVVIGDWTGGATHFTQVAALGPEWAFH